ncbi:MAG: DUF4340 domain-containing protein [Opitutaceae bacterium]|nr:DUF4340 domain-containing protein [Opitutaceae bacterium]
MRTKITLLLLVLVCVSLSYIIFFEKDYNTDPRIFDARGLVLSPKAAEIDYLKIESTRLSSTPILQKTTKGWELVSPISWPANFFAVNRILSQLQFLEKENSFLVEKLDESGQTLADFGLDPADLTLTYGQKGELNQIKIGYPTKSGNRLYILSPDKLRIHVVSLSLLESLSVRIEDLRSNDIFETPVFEIHSWNLQLREAGNLRVRLTQREGNWLFETPISARADNAAVETLLNQITGLKIQSFVQDNSSDLDLLGLINPSMRITLEGNGTRESLLIGNQKTGSEGEIYYYAKKENQATVFTVYIDFLDTLETAQIGLRDRRLFSGTEEYVQSITLTKSGSDSVLLQKLENDSWQVGSRGADQSLQTMLGDETIITNFLRRLLWLNTLADTGFISDAPSAADLERYGLEHPLWTIDISSRKQSSSTTEEEPNGGELHSQSLALGIFEGSDTTHIYAKMRNSPSVYLLDSSILRSLRTNPIYYQSRLLQGIPPEAEINALKITNLGNKTPILSIEIDENTPWTKAVKNLDEREENGIKELLQSLETFKAKALLHNEFTPTVTFAGNDQPWSYLLEISTTPNGGDRSQPSLFSLYPSETTGGTTLLAGSKDLNLVFETDQKFLDAFTTLVSQRPEPEKMAEPIEITDEPSASDDITAPAEIIEPEEQPIPTSPTL